MSKRFLSASIPRVESAQSLTIFERGIASAILAIKYDCARNGVTEVYLDRNGVIYMRNQALRYADELPLTWMVGSYTTAATLQQIADDIRIRLAELGEADFA